MKTEAKEKKEKLAITPEEARVIAKEAYVYGFPVVDNYRVQYSYFINKKDPEYKGAWNEMKTNNHGSY